MYSGTFRPKNPQKYSGDLSSIYYRSSWELSVMCWCDTQPKVVAWNSEEIVLPYICPTDGKSHRYFIDFEIKLDSGKVLWVEVKPLKQTQPPKLPTKSKSKKHIVETMTYVKNMAKWKMAEEIAKKHNISFQIWTQESLKALGIKLLTKTSGK
jgi:hypothetical protein